jgi:putative transposase
MYDRRDASEAQRDSAAWIAKWQLKYPKLVDWVEANIGETFSFYPLPRASQAHEVHQHAGAVESGDQA